MDGPRLSTGPRASTKVRAALAGGLVFGLAAGLTVASWTDAEYAATTFTSSTFVVQTSLQGGAYVTDSSISTSVTGMYPSATLTTGNRYVSLKARTTSGNVAGNVTLAAAANAGGGLTPVLRYRVVSITAATACTAAVFTAGATYIVGGSSAYQQASAALPTTTSVALGASGTPEAHLCIELSIPTSATSATYAGTSATVTWTVTGRSGT